VQTQSQGSGGNLWFGLLGAKTPESSPSETLGGAG